MVIKTTLYEFLDSKIIKSTGNIIFAELFLGGNFLCVRGPCSEISDIFSDDIEPQQSDKL